NGRWLYAPPLPSFWGEPVTVAADGLRLVAPQRDAAFAEALAEALARTRAAVCRALEETGCDVPRPLAVELSRSPASLEVLTDPALLLTQALTLTLPAPSLLGMPQDEAGRHALLRGYAARLALVEIARAVDYECCEQGRFFRALVDAQLDRLGLQPWPLTAADYETLLMEDVRLSHMPAVWLDRSLAYDQDDWRWAHALVAYLTQAADADSPAALLRGLGGSFVTWLQRATREEVPPSTAWPAFVYAQSRSGQLDAPPLPLPADRLQALCSGLSRELTGLYEYDFAASRWGLKMIAGDGYWRSLLLVPLPRPDSYLAQVSTTGAAQTRLQLWRPDEQFVIHEMPDNAARTVAYPLGHDPSGRYTVIGYWSSPRGLDSFGLLDVENCEADACVLRDLPGRPYWSFDGTRTLLLEGAGRPVQVSVGDSQANNQTALGMAQTAFWLDDETIGLLRQADDGTQWIEVVGVAGGTPRTWLTAEALNAVWPAADAASGIHILTAVTATATQLLLVGTPLP
ncbi:MAG: hypothetical protein KC425_25415, partial [Anaerolineales bacterium]|nr:hypothetical protein [Anaerolineales bacterium]